MSINERNIIAVRGNIGSGKSTLLKKMFKEAETLFPGNNILILEPVEEWKPFLEAFRANPGPSTRMALQSQVSLFAKTTWETIVANPTKSIFIERTVEEHIAIFLDGGVDPEFTPLVEFYSKWNFDKFLTKVVDLRATAEVCHARIQVRGQHGDSGISLEYLKLLEGKYISLFARKSQGPSGAITFTGNIGSGKSTAIEAFSKAFPHAKMFKERVDLWGPDLIKFKQTRDPVDLVTLQCKIAACAEEVYLSIKADPKALALVERSVEENINVFVKPHLESGFITQEQYDTIVAVWNTWNYDKLVRYTCVLNTPVEECHRRVSLRGQDGDAGITMEYLKSLDKVYSGKDGLGPIFFPIQSPVAVPYLTLYKKSGVICVTGNIGSGKSTLIRKLTADLVSQGKTVTTLLEPVEEWGDDLCRFKETGKVEDLIVLQKNIASFSKKVYNTLRQEHARWYIIERSNFEHLKIFCEPSLKSGFLNQEQYDEATADYRDYDFDRYITEIIHLDVPHEECYRRIVARGQEGDASIDPGYIEYLGGLYETLYTDGVPPGIDAKLDIRQ